jgi:hypothetical protein
MSSSNLGVPKPGLIDNNGDLKRINLNKLNSYLGENQDNLNNQEVQKEISINCAQLYSTIWKKFNQNKITCGQIINQNQYLKIKSNLIIYKGKIK